MARPEAGDICGFWETKGKHGKAKVEIFERDGKYHGKLVYVEHSTDENGEPLKDVENPDASKRDQPLVGVEIVSNMTFDGRYKWEDGTAYDPDTGKTYKGNIKLPSPDKMKLRGFIGVSALGRTETWKRAAEE